MADLYGPGQMRRETAANWASSNPTMLAGEAGIVTDALPFAMKVGNGVTAFNALGFGPSKIGFGTLNVSSSGFVLGGYAGNSGTVAASAFGAVAHGYAYGSASIAASGKGSLAWGYAYGSGSTITAGTNPGAFAHGWTYSGGDIIASGYGTTASGCASDSGAITASGIGSFANGRADGASSEIRSTNWGSFAAGVARGQGEIRATYPGSFAFGHSYGLGSYTSLLYAQNYGAAVLGQALGTGTVRALGQGSFAQGSAASGESIYAGGQGSVQFAPGSNTVANSVAVGADLRLHADGAPGTPRNGDIWVASGYVYIRSNGISQQI